MFAATVAPARAPSPGTCTPSPGKPGTKRHAKRPHTDFRVAGCDCWGCLALADAGVDAHGRQRRVYASWGYGVPNAPPPPTTGGRRGYVSRPNEGPLWVWSWPNLRAVAEWCEVRDANGWLLELWLLYCEAMLLALWEWEQDERARAAEQEIEDEADALAANLVSAMGRVTAHMAACNMRLDESAGMASTREKDLRAEIVAVSPPADLLEVKPGNYANAMSDQSARYIPQPGDPYPGNPNENRET